ncbi:MAG TPA: DUF1080 domain-containing protein [Pirellulales bacterium]|nr:DUF1080 domain-containing protein [Pirellulales bacterium]
MKCSFQVAFAFAACMLTTLPSSAGEWKSLFNGKDLGGWQAIDGPASSWKVEDGLLFCSGQGSGWLSTDKEYGNFELELEFRVPANGNSGVFLRAPHKGNPAFEGMEIQVLDDYGPDYTNLKPTQYCGSLYDVAPASPRVSKKAGEWQKMQIICNGNSVKVSLNGTQIVNADLTAHPDKLPTHPGLKRTTGYLGLQNHGSRLDYRNIRIREL